MFKRFRRHLWSPNVIARPGFGGKGCLRCGAVKWYLGPTMSSRFCPTQPKPAPNKGLKK